MMEEGQQPLLEEEDDSDSDRDCAEVDAGSEDESGCFCPCFPFGLEGPKKAEASEADDADRVKQPGARRVFTDLVSEANLENLRKGAVAFMDLERQETVSNRTEAQLTLLYQVVMAVINVYFVYCQAIRPYSFLIFSLVANIEFFTACGCALTSAVLAIGLAGFGSKGAMPAYHVVMCLEKAGSFSLLMFMPLPAKLLYWYKNRTPLLTEFGDPSVTLVTWDTGEGVKNYQFDPRKLHHWQVARQCLSRGPLADIVFCFATPVIFAVFVFFRVLFPLLLVVFLVLSIPAALLKVLHFPRKNLEEWTFVDVFMALGVLNQMSKIWSPSMIEVAGFLRNIRAAKAEEGVSLKRRMTGHMFWRGMIQESYKGIRRRTKNKWKDLLGAKNYERGTFMRSFTKLCAAQVGTFDAICFLVVLDVETVGKVLNKGFGAESPYQLFAV